MLYQCPEYGIDGFEPADDSHRNLLYGVDAPELRVLAEHHTPVNSYFILHDQAAIWGVPGSPQLRAVHLSRDLDARTFEVAMQEFPLFAMAESWLIDRRCPPDAIETPDVHVAADALTRALETRVRRDAVRFTMLDSYTDDGVSPQVVVMLRSPGQEAGPAFRILWERYDVASGAHTLREGGFTTIDEARAWWTAWQQGDPPPLRPPAPVPRRGASSAAPVRPASTGLQGRSR